METNKYYKASEGKTFKRIVDDLIMGNELYLNKFVDGTEDSIENYIEVEDDSIELFDITRTVLDQPSVFEIVNFANTNCF